MKQDKNTRQPSRRRSSKPERKSSNTEKKTFWSVIKIIWSYIWKFRAVIISIPVLVYSIILAVQNSARLPDQVGINLLADGTFGMTVSRGNAVLIPVLITFGCILLTCFSKRTLFPWLISVFTLVLPILIWIVNIYPA